MFSTTVAELYSFMKCFGSCQFFRGVCVDISGEVADIHMRTGAKNLINQQDPFSYLNNRRPSTWFLCCERKPVQGIFMIFLTFQLKIAFQIA